jgi:hypothetical protein
MRMENTLPTNHMVRTVDSLQATNMVLSYRPVFGGQLCVSITTIDANGCMPETQSNSH